MEGRKGRSAADSGGSADVLAAVAAARASGAPDWAQLEAAIGAAFATPRPLAPVPTDEHEDE